MRLEVQESGEGTRAGLVRAAAAVFAERGFRDATVRDICRGAGANVAAVNYHFGGKRGLYDAVLLEAAGLKRQVAEAVGARRQLPPEQRLGLYVRALLGRVLAEGPTGRYGSIMTREMVEPTAALDRVVEEFIRPEAHMLGEIVRELVGPGPSEEELRLLAMSVVSQIVFYKHCRPVVLRLFPDMRLDSGALETLAAHITAFCLAGFAAVRKPARKAPRRARDR
jgi:AcrR family transcriptional regulator